MKTISCGCLVGSLVVLCAAAAWGQQSKSAPLVKQLTAALTNLKTEGIAARDPSSPGGYVGALYIPGVELLVIAGRYPAPRCSTRVSPRRNTRTSISS